MPTMTLTPLTAHNTKMSEIHICCCQLYTISILQDQSLCHLPFFLIFFFNFFTVLGLSCFVWAFLYLQRAETTLHHSARDSHNGGFSCRAQVLGSQASVVAACRLGRRCQQALEWVLAAVVHRLRCSRHVGSSWTRSWTRIPCTDGQILSLHHQGSPSLHFYMLCVLVAQSHLTLCDPMDSSPLGFSVHGILQARILGWIAVPFSRGSSPPKDWTLISFIAGKIFTVWATGKSSAL